MIILLSIVYRENSFALNHLKLALLINASLRQRRSEQHIHSCSLKAQKTSKNFSQILMTFVRVENYFDPPFQYSMIPFMCTSFEIKNGPSTYVLDFPTMHSGCISTKLGQNVKG